MNRAFGYITEQRKRSENQDSFGVFPFDGFILAIVCDGMGGHVGGAQASTLAVRTVHEHMANVRGDHGPALKSALERANQAIYETARKNHRLMGMGTTAVAAVLIDDGTMFVAHVGDSRSYLIEDGKAKQLTRDHTMVNLFVDAELLTPEDAATHPEAHVLSRSLGVERQVEVELSEAIDIANDQVIFLCSDGVHGVVTDFELGTVEWADPQPGLQHILDIVEAREGDDNATAVAVRIGSGTSLPPSPLPEPKAIEESLASASSLLADGNTLIPDEDDYEPLSDPRSYGTAPPGTDVEATVDPPTPASEKTANTPPSAKPPTPKKQKPANATATPAPLPRRKPPKESAGASKRPLILAAILGLSLVGVGAAYMATRPSVPEPTATAPITMATPKPGTDPVAPDVEVPAAIPSVFKLDIPKPPRRLPHRPMRYTQTPPAGSPQFQVIEAARDKKCAKSLERMQSAMDVSPDHAKLLSQVWYCFDANHSDRLKSATLQDWKQFGELERHFRGWPEEGQKSVNWTAEDRKVPLWYRPAIDGIEYRIEAWSTTDEEDRIRDVMADLKGEPTVADALATDLLIEAQAAVALAELDEESRDSDLTEAWARRTYVLATALSGKAGRVLRNHRPELVPELEAMLTKATTASEGQRLPPEIQRALDVGRGDAPTPSVKPVRTGPRPLREPDLGSGSDNVQGGIIHR